jgi:hypothetical protein
VISWGEWRHDRSIDSFWVECSLEEGRRIAEKYLASSKQHIYSPEPSVHRRDGQSFQYFLISRDLRYAWSSPPYYPFSGQWNVYCPFRQLPEPITISRLEELAEVYIPEDFRKRPP